MNKIKTEFGEDAIFGFLKLYILDLRLFVNVGKFMSDMQTEQTAQLLVQEFPSLTLADIQLFFKKIKIGEYGQIYDRLDGQQLFIWLTQYFDERIENAEHISHMEHEKRKKDNVGILPLDVVKKTYEKMQNGTYVEPEEVRQSCNDDAEYESFKSEYLSKKIK